MIPSSTLAACLWLAAQAFAQTAPAPAFEVVSIKPSVDGPGDSGVKTGNGRVSAHNVTLKRCMRSAYDVPEAQIVGGPKWLDEERYNIEAKAAGPVDDRELAAMMQAMLAERFQLVFHRETRPLSGYALVVAKGGLKLKASEPDTASRANTDRGRIEAEGCTMALVAQKLAEAVHLPVVDQTAVAGQFSFTLKWTPDEMQAKEPGGPSLFTAVQEQLGLKLEGRKVPTEVLVIDRAEKASAN
jgi:uncharacterized protein (TIGR03435 family)